MRIAMPYNGDPRLVDEVLTDYSGVVDSFYGSLPRDRFGGGRALRVDSAGTLDAIRAVTDRLNRYDIEFNYVINGTNLCNREFLPSYRQEFIHFLNDLRSAGIRIVTLSNIHFIELAREAAPDLCVSASVNLKTRTPAEVQFLLDAGCGDMTLHYDVLKDFQALKAIRRMTDIDLKLIPNDVYIMGCPWQKGHTRMQAAHSRDNGYATPYFSYYRNKCVNLRQHRPEETLKAMWVPPDQLWRYEAAGYDYFKLLDRLASTSWNMRVLRAYVSRQPVDEVQQLLGTCGAIHTSRVPDPVAENDAPYPIEKLEVIPELRTQGIRFNRLFGYFAADNHPTLCGSCRACTSAASHSVAFPVEARQRVIDNNRAWQSKVTKAEFPESLGPISQRIRYE